MNNPHCRAKDWLRLIFDFARQRWGKSPVIKVFSPYNKYLSFVRMIYFLF